MLVLVRHGETALNAARVLQPADTPLSERGRLQAERLGQRLHSMGVARVLASDLPRARMTAQAIVQRIPVPLEEEPLLAERSFGDLRGTPYSELTVDVFHPDYSPPGGESLAAFERRVARAWERVVETVARTEGTLVVVSHGLVCRSIARRFLRLPLGRDVPLRFGNTSVTVVERQAPFRVRLLDCTAHLDEGTADDGSAARV